MKWIYLQICFKIIKSVSKEKLRSRAARTAGSSFISGVITETRGWGPGRVLDTRHRACSWWTGPLEHLVTAWCLRRNKLSFPGDPSAPHVSASSQHCRGPVSHTGNVTCSVSHSSSCHWYSFIMQPTLSDYMDICDSRSIFTSLLLPVYATLHRPFQVSPQEMLPKQNYNYHKSKS